MNKGSDCIGESLQSSECSKDNCPGVYLKLFYKENEHIIMTWKFFSEEILKVILLMYS
jgi:hypothetical protein